MRSAIKNQRWKQRDLFVSAFNNVLYLRKQHDCMNVDRGAVNKLLTFQLTMCGCLIIQKL